MPEISHLRSAETMRKTILGVGFALLAWNDVTEGALRPGSRAVATRRSPDARTASAMLRPKPLVPPVQPPLRHPNPRFSLLDRLLVNHRLALRLADITLEPLTQLFAELLISDEIAKVVGKVIVEYRLET